MKPFVFPIPALFRRLWSPGIATVFSLRGRVVLEKSRPAGEVERQPVYSSSSGSSTAVNRDNLNHQTIDDALDAAVGGAGAVGVAGYVFALLTTGHSFNRY